MENLKEMAESLYHPKSALVVYESKNRDSDLYVEYFDMDDAGCPVNAHPLTVIEAEELAKALDAKSDIGKAFLKSKGIIPAKVLHINPANDGKAIWFTKPMTRQLFFVSSLGIPSGKMKIPAMVWVADVKRLNVYALQTGNKPKLETELYHAPYFNVYKDGNVCMGTIDINISGCKSLEEFMKAWENYFFNSYFSHLLQENNPVKGNLVTLCKRLIETGEVFPTADMIKTGKKLKNIIA